MKKAAHELAPGAPAPRRRRAIARTTVALGILGLVLLGSDNSAHASGTVLDCTEASLRAALDGGGVVTFSNDCSLTIGAQIVINQAGTTIDANGFNVSISGSNAVPLFKVATNLTLLGLSLVNGASPNSGGALYIQPGVVVIANGCIFVGNSAAGTNGAAGANGATNSVSTGGNGSSGAPGISTMGGAIYNAGDLTLVDCTLTNNTAAGGNGGNGGNGGAGGGVFAVGGNGGDGASGGFGRGGAVYNAGDLTLTNCTFSGNTATGGSGGTGGANGAGSYPGLNGNGGQGGSGSGGGVFNANNLTILASTFSANIALGGTSATAGMHGNGTGMTGANGGIASGGGVYNASLAAVTNCTFYTNIVFGGTGGNGGAGGGTFGVAGNGGDGGDGVGGALDNANTITIVNCTFSTGGAIGGTNGVGGSGSFAGASGVVGGAQGGNIANSGDVLTLIGTILTASVSGANAFGSISDGGYNLSSDSVSSFGSTSLQNTDPDLGPLVSNGGPTLTMALLTNSPAIGKIPSAASVPTDQRGAPRPINGLSDIGAYQSGATVTVSNIVLSINLTTNGLVQLNGAGSSGFAYLVQASIDLVNWQTISTNVAPIQFTDLATNVPARFYRIAR